MYQRQSQNHGFFHCIVIHSDSTSAIARMCHSGAGPGQGRARNASRILYELFTLGVHGIRRLAELRWVKGDAGTPGNERADKLAGEAAGREKWSEVASLTYLKLRISEKFRKAKDEWHSNPKHHGTEEIPPPASKKPCMDRTKNAIARTAAQIWTGHWRSAVYFKRIEKRGDDRCWFCHERKMTRSRALLHCANDELRAAPVEAWEGKDPGSIRLLLNNPRWEKRLLRILELSGWEGWWKGTIWTKPGLLGWTGGSRGRQRRGSPSRALYTILFFPSVFPFKRAPSLELCSPRMLGSEDFLGVGLARVLFSSIS